MKPDPESELENLRTAFCGGNKDVLERIFDLCFDEIFANLKKGELSEQVGELYLLKEEISNNPSILCGQTMDVRTCLRKVLSKKQHTSLYKEKSYGADYIFNKPKENADPEPVELPTEIPAFVRYFLSSFSPIDRMFYEVKYVQELKNRNGLFLVVQFLLNKTSTGNDPMTAALKKYDLLSEPKIPDFLLHKSLLTLTSNRNVRKNKKQQLLEKGSGTLTDILQVLKHKNDKQKKDFNKVCHTRDIFVFREHNLFKQEEENCKELEYLEKTLYFMNRYLPIEDCIEVWLQLNLDAHSDQNLEEGLKKAGLLNEHILPKYAGLRRKAIVKRIAIGVKKQKLIAETIREIQNDIDQKLKTQTQWKTH